MRRRGGLKLVDNGIRAAHGPHRLHLVVLATLQRATGDGAGFAAVIADGSISAAGFILDRINEGLEGLKEPVHVALPNAAAEKPHLAVATFATVGDGRVAEEAEVEGAELRGVGQRGCGGGGHIGSGGEGLQALVGRFETLVRCGLVGAVGARAAADASCDRTLRGGGRGGDGRLGLCSIVAGIYLLGAFAGMGFGDNVGVVRSKLSQPSSLFSIQT